MTPFIKNLSLAVSAYILVFGAMALMRGNLEFLIYVGVVIFFFVLLIRKHERLGLGNDVLIGLSVWGGLHMAGGNVRVGDGVLYGLQLIPVVLRYDQLVHFFGFGVTTVVGWQLLRPYLVQGFNKVTISVLLVMIGTGAGALNEVIEFTAVLILPETGVGGYFNTGWDMVANLCGALVALIYVWRREMPMHGMEAALVHRPEEA